MKELSKYPKDILSMGLFFLLLPFLMVPTWVYEYSTQKHLVFSIFYTIMFFYYFYKIQKEKYEIKYSLNHIYFSLFGLATVFSLISVLIQNKYYFRYSFEVAFYILMIVFVSYILTNRFGEKFEYIEAALFIFLITGFIIGFDGLLNKFYGFDLFFGKYGDPSKRITLRTTIGNPNFVSDYMGQMIPIAIYFALSKKSNMYKRFFSIISIFIMFWVLLFAQTRSIYLSFFLGMMIFTFFFTISILKNKDKEQINYIKSKRFIIPLILIILTFSFLVVMFNIPSPFNKSGEVVASKRFEAMTSVSSWDERTLSWLAAVEQWKDSNHPTNKIIGGGIATYPVYAVRYMADIQARNPEKFYYAWNNFKRAHNDYLQVLGETGLLGFIPIILLLFGLIVIFLKRVFKLKDFDKILMFNLFAWSLTIVAIHSFTEFPMHLHPNIMSALFIISIAVSEQFGETKKITIHKNTLKSLFIVFFIIGIIVSYLKIQSTAAEVYFKIGNTEYMKIDAYENVVKKQIPSILKQIDDKINQYKNYKVTNPVELQKVSNEIKNLEEQKQKYLSTKADYENKAFNSYKKAKEYFLKSLKANSAFGKSGFYLAQLLAKTPYRLMELDYNNLEKYMDMKTPEYAFMLNKFEGPIDLMPFNRPQIRDTIKRLYILLKNENNIQLSQALAYIQSIQDEIDQLESNYISFNEKNAYRLIAKLNVLIFQNLSNIEKFFNSNEKVVNEITILKEKYYNDFVHWFNKTIEILPGGWNRFPEWEDVYTEYMKIMFNFNNYLGYEKTIENIIEISKKEGKADYYMAKKFRGIPDKSFDFFESLYFHLKTNGMNDLAIKLSDAVIKNYKDVYDFYILYLEKYPDYRYKERVENFIKVYNFLKK
ncbi:O-antigen ligase [Marinitoga hydrogenitolerans DSM 16785]|uniref:O-antigen ligase n=1 Tax=Marinitoga hydrogenitolerans (strain DSM 16785 / JCM 12826 / AT1271) TaxID=1122195 RepID=A0A1M4SMT8_MARH1|nr:O-antigen ligase family protein [Marinitoga hydrogenitolerans]SHE33498.1 O-antigen ligase [Marinitoga hydrogenitolerans DSM 16785]